MKPKLVLILIFILFFTFRLPGLGSDISNTDAYKWHYRSQNFLTAIKTGDLRSTYQHYQPGVTLMWINAVVKQAAFTAQYRLLGVAEPKTLQNADWYPVIHGISKAVLVLILGVMLWLQIYLIKNIFDDKIALFYGFFVSVEPYLIGMDRWFHLTSLETYFGFTSFLFLLWWYQEPRDHKLVRSGVFFGLSVLSKVTTLLTVPLCLLMIYVKGHKSFLKNVAIFSTFALLTCVTLFPALIADPSGVLVEMFTLVKNTSLSTNRNFEHGNLIGPLFYVINIILKMSPVTLLLFVISLINYKKINEHKPVLTWLLLYFSLYFVSLTTAGKKIDRYVIVMFPSMILLGSYFLSRQKSTIIKTVLGLSLALAIFVSYLYYPVYSSYNSPLFGGTKMALKLGIYDNSGEYFAQAASYLNGKGRDKKVYVPNGGGSFDYYYKGVRIYNAADKPDYVVVSLDFGRLINDRGCHNEEARFGSRETAIVYIFKCEP